MAPTFRRFRISTGLALSLVAGLGPVAIAPSAMAAETPATYTKKTISVYQASDDPVAGDLASALSAMGRFEMVTFASDPGTGVASFIQRVRDTSGAAGKGGGTYVFSTRYSLGSPIATEMKADSRIDKSTGKMTGEMYAFLKCPLIFNVDIYEAGSGRAIKQLRFPTTVDRKYKYDFTEQTTPDAHRLKQEDLQRTLRHDLRLPPEVVFTELARDEMSRLNHGAVLANVRAMAEFELAVGVSGWDAKNDLVFFGLGQDLRVRVDDGFKVFQDGREIGFLKVRRSDKSSSAAQPIFMDGTLRVGDKVVEYNKTNWWNGFKGGGLWMGSPGWMASYDGDLDVGTLFGASELSLVYHGAYLSSAKTAGFQGELGFTKKWFVRRWGFGVGPRFGVTHLMGPTHDSNLLGGTLAFTAHCYLTPDIVWTSDLGLTAYQLTDPSQMGITGLAKGATVSPLGPTLQTGFTFVF